MSIFRAQVRLVFSTAILVGIIGVPAVSVRGDDGDDPDQPRPGMLGTYEDFGGNRFVRRDLKLAFDWGRGSVDRRLEDGRFRVTWRGLLLLQADGDYELRVHAAGRVKVKLAGRTLIDDELKLPGWLVSDTARLPFGYQPIEIRFESNDRPPRFALFWSGPGFEMEPVSPRFLAHEPEDGRNAITGRGARLAVALRCAACHDLAKQKVGGLPGAPPDPVLAASPLNDITDHVHPEWIVQRLTAAARQIGEQTQKMPHFGLPKDDARAIVAALRHGAKRRGKRATDAKDKKTSGQKKDKRKKPRKPDAKIGRQLVLKRGCLACHRLNEFGQSGWYGGGDLTTIAAKRPAEFFAVWLTEPERINFAHRMPVFELTRQERADVAALLGSLGKRKKDALLTAAIRKASQSEVERGRHLIDKLGCRSCHKERDDDGLPTAARGGLLSVQSNWDDSCLDRPKPGKRPGYALAAENRDAIRDFVTGIRSRQPTERSWQRGEQVLAEQNCLQCHAREGASGIAAGLPALAKAHPELAPLLPALTPPSLNSVGDKLQNAALDGIVTGKLGAHRPWLEVRMPKFKLSEPDRRALVGYLIGSDRIPSGARRDNPSPPPRGLRFAADRLVTTDGFGCTSCHQVGSVMPPKAPLNALGPNLSEMGKRIRFAWYDRWVRNPARIVPRMEMPSVKLPVKSVLGEDLDDQLHAVWHVLNDPRFEPPRPNPVRVVRRSGKVASGERAAVLTDVIHSDEDTYIKPLLIGLPSRQNFFYDLAEARLVRWSIGDVARQRTKGKTWYWEAAGVPVLTVGSEGPEWELVEKGQGGDDAKPLAVVRRGQFLSELDHYEHVPGGVEFRHRVAFGRGDNQKPQTVTITQRFTAERDSPATRRQVLATGLQPGQTLRLRLAGGDGLKRAQPIKGEPPGLSWKDREKGDFSIIAASPNVAAIRAGMVELQPGLGGVPAIALFYVHLRPADQFVITEPAVKPPPPLPLNVVPGFDAMRLPLADELMPTGIAWHPDGRLMVTSLKGRVWTIRDSDGDGLEDHARPFSDELAAPFGLHATSEYVDVVNKYGLLRLRDKDGDGHAESVETLASGWGHTADYHDWTVGLPIDSAGNYFVASACQQDKRSPAAARWRGAVLKLARRTPTADNPHRYGVERISGGHRFPIGIARRHDGELFVTDNQGNYNPFNELNHVIAGARYGFINSIERKPGFAPPLTPPAIDIPHPWTRSVNGICFLETPRTKAGRATMPNAFGPFTGHLIGCEYDTRRLIRMSLERVGDTIQGAAYPFSYNQPAQGEPLLGPLTVAVSPRGEIYIGCIRDSGWGGANNIGTLVRLKMAKQLPPGIAEVRAAPDGLRIEFTQPVDRRRAAATGNYSILSYTRTSTPAYGGKDQDRRNETIRAAEPADEGRSVRLRLDKLRSGYVYELHVKGLVADDTPFFPAEAYYTMRNIPAK